MKKSWNGQEVQDTQMCLSGRGRGGKDKNIGHA